MPILQTQPAEENLSTAHPSDLASEGKSYLKLPWTLYVGKKAFTDNGCKFCQYIYICKSEVCSTRRFTAKEEKYVAAVNNPRRQRCRKLGRQVFRTTQHKRLHVCKACIYICSPKLLDWLWDQYYPHSSGALTMLEPYL